MTIWITHELEINSGMSTINKDQLDRNLPQFAGSLAIPSGDQGPVFRQPWEAKAFAMVVQMHSMGLFTWKEWVSHLSDVIAEASEHHMDDGSRYYYHWLAACERVLAANDLISNDEITEREKIVVNEIHHAHEHQKHHRHNIN